MTWELCCRLAAVRAKVMWAAGRGEGVSDRWAGSRLISSPCRLAAAGYQFVFAVSRETRADDVGLLPLRERSDAPNFTRRNCSLLETAHLALRSFACAFWQLDVARVGRGPPQ